jgi:MATE family multidrug resistance protein
MGKQIRSRGELVRFALQTVLIQLGLHAFSLVDTVVIGQVGTVELAGTAVGARLLWLAQMIPYGLLFALDPVVSQAHGRGDADAVRLALQRACLIAAVLLGPAAAFLAAAEWVLPWLDQKPDLVPPATLYARISIAGLPPFLLFCALRQTMQAMGRTRAILAAICAVNVLNLLLDLILVHGFLGGPELGVAGVAWASVISRWVLAGLVLVGGRSVLWPMLARWERAAFSPAGIGRLLGLGAPIAGAILLEMGAFQAVAFMMGWISTAAVAAHEVALQLAATTYMVPLGISSAAAVAVGQAVGRLSPVEARHAARRALVLGGSIMALFALAFFVAAEPLARIWTAEAEPLRIALTLIPLAGLFQVFDGLQVVATGALRGLGDTRSPLFVCLFGFWVVGLPVSYGAERAGFGPAGLWWGLTAGLTLVAIVLLWLLRRRLRSVPTLPDERRDP